MIQKLIAKFKALNPFLQGLAALFTIVGVVGGFDVFEEEPSNQSIISNNNQKSVLITNDSDRVSSQKLTPEIHVNTENQIESPKKRQVPNTYSLFLNSPLKKNSQTSISILIVKDDLVDSKTARIITNSIKRQGLSVISQFSNEALNFRNELLSPSEDFIVRHKISDYLDYYFICELSPLKTKKNPTMGTFTSALNIEGYLINTNTINAIQFPYRNIKGSGLSESDASLNLKQDLEEKITKFIAKNLL